MGKIAFVFSGQGAQKSGMGKSFYDNSPAAKALYDAAEQYRGGTIKQSFEGSDEELKDTKNTQPCLYLADLAAAKVLNEHGIYADGVAGFSLGEIPALAYAGAYSDTDGFKIAVRRGICMAEAASAAETAMCAVLKLDASVVEAAAAEFEGLYAVNYNAPGQTAVSGLKSSMGGFEKKIAELGGRCVPLAVSAAFHSPFMEEASKKFGRELNGFEFSAPKIPVYSNQTAQPYDDKIAERLEAQMKNPVLWRDTIENMIADGYTDFIEVGIGKTLCGLIKKTSKEVGIYSAEDYDTLLKTVKEIDENA